MEINASDVLIDFDFCQVEPDGPLHCLSCGREWPAKSCSVQPTKTVQLVEDVKILENLVETPLQQPLAKDAFDASFDVSRGFEGPEDSDVCAWIHLADDDLFTLHLDVDADPERVESSDRALNDSISEQTSYLQQKNDVPTQNDEDAFLDHTRRAALADAVAHAIPGLDARLAEQRQILDQMMHRCDMLKCFINEAFHKDPNSPSELKSSTSPRQPECIELQQMTHSNLDTSSDAAYTHYKECPARERLRAALDKYQQASLKSSSAMTTSFGINVYEPPTCSETEIQTQESIDEQRAREFMRNLAMKEDFPEPLRFGVAKTAAPPAPESAALRPGPTAGIVPAWEFSLRKSADAQRYEDVIACLKTNLAEVQADLQEARSHVRRLKADNEELRYELQDARLHIARVNAENRELLSEKKDHRSKFNGVRPWINDFSFEYDLEL